MKLSFNSSVLLKRVIFLVFLASTTPLLAQQKCGIVQYEALREDKSSYINNKEGFEQWIENKIDQKKITQIFQTQAEGNDLLIIPVVVHIIHNGEQIGEGTNLPNSRIFEQIEILNNDFRKLNADTVNTPGEFKLLASDTKIEFRLAKRNPEGIATNGILRVEGTQSNWSVHDNVALKSLSYWPAEDYLNIWVTRLRGNLLGYAQFPVSDLEGLEAASNNRMTDGIVVTSAYFGINNDITPASKGRTATHEVGHFLGLRHIWGDGDCDADDFCEDTPPASGFSSGCPSEKATCGSNDMFQNYMDFTDDGCMNIFTHNQNDRMQAVLTNSPRRESLLTSKGAEKPVIVSNDAGIKEINSPLNNNCSNNISPEITIRNYGDNIVSAVKIRLLINGEEAETLSRNINLAPLEQTIISFSAVNITNAGANEIDFEIMETNGTNDNNADNNFISIELNITEVTEPPVIETFNNFPDHWSIENPDNDLTWEIATVPEEEQQNTALFLNFYDYERGLSEQDYFITPPLKFNDLISAKLEFKVAYAQYSGGSNDGLLVAISRDCGNTFKPADMIYEKFGNQLATADDKGSPFVPKDRLDWRLEQIDLSQYIGNELIRIAFIGQNDFGNNLYIDDIAVNVRKQFVHDIGITKMWPSSISCDNNINPEVQVKNYGTATVSAFQVKLQVDNNEAQSINYDGPDIVPGETIIFPLPSFSLNNGGYKISMEVNDPNKEQDANTIDNKAGYNLIVSAEGDQLPIREKFASDGFSGLEWFFKNPDQDTGWEIVATKTGNFSALLKGYDYESVGEEDWLISPSLDFSNTAVAQLFFDLSYTNNRNFTDSLEIRISTDCGETFPHIIYSKSGNEISIAESTAPWRPSTREDWKREFVDLSGFSGHQNIRIAFVAINGNGNNLYLDNIEFFVDENTAQVEVPVNQYIYYPNPANERIHLTFNLEQKEIIAASLYNIQGKIIYNLEYPNTLNQTYPLNLQDLNNGVYLLKVSGQTFNEVNRIIITR